MKKLTSIVIIALTFSAAPVFAISTKDLACGAMICLSGEGGSACSLYLDNYFSIKKKKKGKLCSPCTKIARKLFLQQCDYVDAPTIEQVSKQYVPSTHKAIVLMGKICPPPEQRAALEKFLRNSRFQQWLV